MSNLKGFAVVLLVVAVIFLGVKLLPPFVANYNLHADTDNMVLQYTYAQAATPDAIKADVIAKAKEHDITLADEDVDVDTLVVSEAYVNEGPRMKRVRPAPMGRAYRYQRRMSHIVIKVAGKDKE